MPDKPTRSTEETISAECIAIRLRTVNRVVSRIYDNALRPLGLRSGQLGILVATARYGIARPADLSERLKVDVSTLSRNLERMKDKGWLEVVPDNDGRAQPFRLTRKGRNLLERAKPKWDEAQADVQKLLGPQTFEAIDAAAKKVWQSN